jgi:benzoyl-CoA reductase/2-hydroxyglutaryl-CoA dehydratase subunit BcrC/BadD/HgdB
MRFTLITLSTVLLSCSFSVQAKMYKWVDENGQMHFGDKIPQKYMEKEHDELNERGMKVKHKEAEKTAQEKAEEQRLEEERKKAAIEAEKKKKLDRVLLDAYDSESDLIVARDSRLDAVASQIHLSEAIISESNKKIESMEIQVAEIKASGREVPNNLYESIAIEKQQVASQTRVMESHKKRSVEISEKYNDYIKRFRDAQVH